MKTVVSIPDEVFEGVERLARCTKRSRSRLFSDALKKHLARHTPYKVPEATDKAWAEIDEGPEKKDPFVSSAAGRTLERTEW
jgi:predicted transcriptional regulator